MEAVSPQSEAEDTSNLDSKQRLALAMNSLSALPQVDNTIQSKLSSEATLLEEIPQYLFQLGGKRLRPVLCLMFAEALGMQKATQELVDVAAGIELIHMATLLHDDIIDNSPIRRHSTSPYKKFGFSPTLLAGDFLLVRAFALCAHLDDYIINSTEKACVHLTEGEILETPLFADHHDLKSSLEIARKKTASLFRLAADSAHHLTLPELDSIDSCSFAENLGIAFQVLDDVLDVISTEDILGKQPGVDVVERKPSIVNVLWLQSGSELAKCLLTPQQEQGSKASNDERLAALKELRKSDVVNEAKKIANSYLEKAEASLMNAIEKAPSPNHSRVNDLLHLMQFTRERMY